MENIYDYIKKEEAAYTKEIELEDGWNWNMDDHLRRSFLYKHSQFEEDNEDRDLRPFNNIVKPILNIQYRTEGFDVKDIEIYVNDYKNYYKSFFVKKYHDKWALENSIDTFIDDAVESYVDYGGILARDTDENRPEVIDLRSLAFCNQTNILNNPFCIKHNFSRAELRKFTKWQDVERLITLAKDEKEIVVYELHGILPGEWIGGEGDIPQIQIVSFYKDQNNNKIGITLFKSKEPKLPFKFLARDKISGRALGWGGVEELFEPQIWTNWNEITIMEMLDSASKTLYKSNDPAFKTRNNIRDVDNNEVLTLQDNKDISQLDTYPRNLAAFNNAVERWAVRARELGSASEGLMGGELPSGIPFKLFEAKSIEDKSMHKYRQGKIAVFMDEIYRDWILPHLAREIIKDQTFLTELSAEEMQTIGEQIIINEANKFVIRNVLNGKFVEPAAVEAYKEQIRMDFMKGNKKFVQILKDELKDAPLAISTNIAGKQKDLALLTDKVVNVLRQFIATPQIRQDPEMIKLLNVILESSGMSPIMFGAAPAMQPPAKGGTEPLKELSQTQLKAKQMEMV